MPHVNKNTSNEKIKFGSNKKPGLERTMNGLRKPFRKIDQKNRNRKIQVKLPHGTENH